MTTFAEKKAYCRPPATSRYFEALAAGLALSSLALTVSLGLSAFFYLGSGPDPLPVIHALWVPSSLDSLFAQPDLSGLSDMLLGIAGSIMLVAMGLSAVYENMTPVILGAVLLFFCCVILSLSHPPGSPAMMRSASAVADKTLIHPTRSQFVHGSPARITATVERLLRGKVTPAQTAALELVLAQNEVLHRRAALPGLLKLECLLLDVAAPQSPWLREGRPRRTLVALNRAEHADPAQVYAFLAKVQARKQSLFRWAVIWSWASVLSGFLLVLSSVSVRRLSRREFRIARLQADLDSCGLTAEGGAA